MGEPAARVGPTGKNPPGTRVTNKSASVSRMAIFLLVVFVSVYSLTYSGTFITDDEQILASRAMSLAFDGSPNDARVYGNSRVYALSKYSPEQATQAVNIEPGQELVGTLLARISTLLHVGRVQTLFLLNIWVTALIVAAVFGIVLISGHTIKTALAISILFGLGTTAWPYARTYFRDPLAVLFLTLAWGCVQVLVEENGLSISKRIRWLSWSGLVIFLAAGILAKNTIAIALPVVMVRLIPVFRRYLTDFRVTFSSKPARGWRVGLPIAGLCLLLVVWIAATTGQPLLARFSPAYYASLVRFFFSTPHPHLLEALAGPFVSPGKSIFLYSPLLILAVIAGIRHLRTAWPAWLYTLLLVIGQALFYDADWWGHINWGLRFILPAMPLLLIASAPIVENWLKSTRGRIGIAVLAGISIGVQLVGLLPPMVNYYVENSQAVPAVSDFVTLWTLKYSALAWHLKWLFSGGRLDLALIRVGAASIPVAVGLVAVIVLGTIGLWRTIWRALPAILVGFVLGLQILMLFIYAKDPAYYSSRTDLADAEWKVAHDYQPGDTVLVKSYSSPAWYHWMDWASPQEAWSSLPFYFPTPDQITQYNATHDPGAALDDMTLSLLKKIPALYRRVWLVLPDDSPGSSLGLEAAWLKNISITSLSWDFPGLGNNTKLYLFDIDPGK